MVLCLYFKFRIFDKPVLEEYVSQVEGAPHLFQSCLRVVQNGVPPTVGDMHLLFESLAVISAPRL